MDEPLESPVLDDVTPREPNKDDNELCDASDRVTVSVMLVSEELDSSSVRSVVDDPSVFNRYWEISEEMLLMLDMVDLLL